MAAASESGASVTLTEELPRGSAPALPTRLARSRLAALLRRGRERTRLPEISKATQKERKDGIHRVPYGDLLAAAIACLAEEQEEAAARPATAHVSRATARTSTFARYAESMASKLMGGGQVGAASAAEVDGGGWRGRRPRLERPEVAARTGVGGGGWPAAAASACADCNAATCADACSCGRAAASA
jgi:hypothetical protein